MNRPKITHVAIRFQEKIYSLPAPKRHYDVIRLIVDTLNVPYVDSRDEDQGFLDADGRFLNRKQALVNAQVNNQILDPAKVYAGMLFSENLW